MDSLTGRVCLLLPLVWCNTLVDRSCSVAQVLNVHPLACVEEHACVNHCHLFDKTSQRDWKFHKDDQCPVCHEPRFKLVSCGIGRQPCLLPRRRFWHIGLQRVIRDYFFPDPRCIWCALRNKTSPIDRHGYRSSADCQRLAAALPPGLLDDKDTGLWELGIDLHRTPTEITVHVSLASCMLQYWYAWICKHAYAFLCSLALLLANDAMILLLTLSDAHLSDAYSCDHMHHHMSSGSGVGP